MAARLNSGTLHALALGALLFGWWPIAKFWYTYRPLFGIDFFLSVSLLEYLKRNFALPWDGWKYIWYGGNPWSSSYPFWNTYVMLPLERFLGSPSAILVMTLASYTLLLVFTYVLLHHLSKSRLLALGAALATSYSANLYGAFVWGGSHPYLQTIFFLPLTLYLTVRYLEARAPKYLYLTAALLGLAALIHPLSLVGWTIPLVVLLQVFWHDERTRFFDRFKYKHLLGFLLVTYLAGYPQFSLGTTGGPASVIYGFIGALFRASQAQLNVVRTAVTQVAAETAGSPYTRLYDAYSWTNLGLLGAAAAGVALALLAVGLGARRPALRWLAPVLPIAVYGGAFLWLKNHGIDAFAGDRHVLWNVLLLYGTVALLAIAIVGVALRSSRSSLRRLTVFLPLVLYGGFFLLSFASGFNPFSGGWFRVFWPITLLYGVLLAVTWRTFREAVHRHLEGLGSGHWAGVVPRLALGALLGVGVLAALWYGYRDIPNQRKRVLDYQQVSSAFPIDLNQQLGPGWKAKLPRLVPEWLDPNRRDVRLYTGDATIAIWWNALFDMPQARGYLDSPAGRPNYGSWQYLQNVALAKDELSVRLGYPEDLAKNTALFFLDWHAIKYAEAGVGFARNYPTILSTYVRGPDVTLRTEKLEFVEQQRTFVQEGRYWPAGWETGSYVLNLDYFEFRDEVTSPIFQATDAPRLAFVSDDEGQDTLMRLLAARNVNSRKLVYAQLPPDLGHTTDEQLAWYDAIVLYRYDLPPSAWPRLAQYVERGGRLFVDTGSDQRESTTPTAPSVFPMRALERRPYGPTWEPSGGGSLTAGLDLGKLGPLVYQDAPWSLSVPTTPFDLDPGAKVELAHAGLPVLVSQDVGSGRVLWSGFNFPYHLRQYLAEPEIALFDRILEYLVGPLTVHTPTTRFERPKSELVRIHGNGEPAVLFKEAAYPGWSARIAGDGGSQRLPILEAGPQFPGYMLVAVPTKFRGKLYTVTFRYRGTWSYRLQWFVGLATILLVAVGFFFPRRFATVVAAIAARVRFRSTAWWNRDDPDDA